MKKHSTDKELIMYQSADGSIAFRGDAEKETMWATQQQIADVFGVTVPTINEHIKNIFESNELEKKATIRKFLIVRKEGKRDVSRDVVHYNLDLIISVGYRVNSKVATHFRKWATKTLRQHITEGYTINKKLLAKNYDKFNKALADVQKILPKESLLSHDDIIELVRSFAGAWFSLESYDEDTFPNKGVTKKSVKLQADDLYTAVAVFKEELIKKGEASDLFAREKQPENLAGIVGNVMQSFGGTSVYATVEEKAAHLLYFVVKNHPFDDGNKRTGAFAFVWFLQKSGVQYRHKITPEALAVITLLVAESEPVDKDRMIGLILLVLNQ